MLLFNPNPVFSNHTNCFSNNCIYTVSHAKVNIKFPLFIVGVTCFYRDEMVEYFYML